MSSALMQLRFFIPIVGAAMAGANAFDIPFFPMHKNQNRALGEIA
jgi:hypothetical protein